MQIEQMRLHRLEEEVVRQEHRHREDRFIRRITQYFHSRTITYREAMCIVQEMLSHMQPEEAHKFLHEMFHINYDQIGAQCHDRYMARQREVQFQIMQQEMTKMAFVKKKMSDGTFAYERVTDDVLDELIASKKEEFIGEGEMEL